MAPKLYDSGKWVVDSIEVCIDEDQDKSDFKNEL
jgi:hypothetical protein